MKEFVWLGFVLGALSAAGNVIRTSAGRRVTLGCGIDTFESSLEWNHGKEMIYKVSGKSGMNHNGPAAIRERSRVRQNNLEISGVKREDAGRFTCVADEIPKYHTLLVVSVSASPPEELPPGSNVTLHCEVKGLNPDSTVQWTGPDGRPHAVSETVHLQRVAPSDAGTWVCAFSYDGQTYSENLDIKVRDPARKVITSPPPRIVDQQTTYPSCDLKPHSGVGRLGWWLWVAVGGGCLVVLLLVVLVIVLCKRSRRRKRKLQKLKNGRQSLTPKKYCQCNCPTAAASPRRGRQKGKPSAPPLQPLLME